MRGSCGFIKLPLNHSWKRSKEHYTWGCKRNQATNKRSWRKAAVKLITRVERGVTWWTRDDKMPGDQSRSRRSWWKPVDSPRSRGHLASKCLCQRPVTGVICYVQRKLRCQRVISLKYIWRAVYSNVQGCRRIVCDVPLLSHLSCYLEF